MITIYDCKVFITKYYTLLNFVHFVSLPGFAEYHDGSSMFTTATILSSLEEKKNWYKCVDSKEIRYANYSNAYEDCNTSNSSIQTYFSKRATLILVAIQSGLY